MNTDPASFRALKDYERIGFHYFSALLTFNGILLAFFAVRLSPRAAADLSGIANLLIWSALVSVGILLHVFHSFKANAEDTARIVRDVESGNTTHEEAEPRLQALESRRDVRKWEIRVVEALVAVELLCIAILLLS